MSWLQLTKIEQKLDEALELLRKRPNALAEAIKVLSEDNHDWSTRPCATCKTISAALGEPFGCYWYAKKKGE